ncbi:PorP/SprF family type IX secretion system membrane protein [Echinicola marina]|uniref:PorP/SprF family type IX secretion system membrane protein n=1 Tax=Echinicola marina TaxID=2859768 RepID=UPI001CF64E4B|nr:PorP/SprF family type IX secretion system membrane protein [Echinicola marina]UCS95622.1 PorP/SprF family type IX secretion system membrane protein [Echinicola marina]
MKRILIILIVLFPLVLGMAHAQSRKYISHFSNFKSYYNPSLVAHGGSVAQSIVRNQWGGLPGAPKTILGSVEGDFSQLRKLDSIGIVGRNAAGLVVLFDQHGPFSETEILLNYTNRIRITENHMLGLGIGMKYLNTELDGTKLSPEQENDPGLSRYMGGFAESKVFDFNLGISLINKQYYLSYSLQNVSGAEISSGDDFYEGRAPISNLQAGFRGMLSPNVGLVGNMLYRMQKDLPFHQEFNVKAVMMEKVWLGVGHRVDYATNLQAGFMFDRFRVGYVYEMSTKRNSKMYGSTHEFMVSFSLFEKGKQGVMGIW